MGPQGRRRLKRFVIAGAIATTATVLCGWLFGPLAGTIVAVIGFLGVAIASDDGVGTFFVLAVLLVLILILILMGLVAAILVNR